jgi:dinuclear metal center YbgI/SA1388 family protein
MATTVRTLLAHAEQLLDAHAFADFCPIGMQVAGRREDVTAIATAVSSTLDSFQGAADAGAQVLLVHHGMFWDGDPYVVDATRRERLAVLFDAGITLAGYHLSLDAHPTLGNNALLADALGLTRTDEPFVVHKGRQIGLVGRLDEPLEQDSFTELVTAAVDGREPLVLGASRDGLVSKVAVSSGGSARSIDEAVQLGCDAFITGEPREDTLALARELGIAFYAAGHHATERGGIRALSEWLTENTGLDVTFIDIPNPA